MFSNHSHVLVKQELYNLRRNVGLDDAEASPQLKQFISRTRKTILFQVNAIINDDGVLNDLIFLTAKAEANRNMVGYLSSIWKTFGDVFKNLFGEESLDSFYFWAGESGGQAALDRMGIELDFVLRNEEVTIFLRQQKNLMIASVDETTKEEIARIITQGREGLLSEFEIKQLLKERFTDFSDSRSETIARSELANAFNSVEFETFQRNKVTKVRWVTVIDERVCPICEPLHNMEMNIGGEFVSDARNSQHPPAHPNCRCFLEEVISGVEVRNNAIVWTGA